MFTGLSSQQRNEVEIMSLVFKMRKLREAKELNEAVSLEVKSWGLSFIALSSSPSTTIS